MMGLGLGAHLGIGVGNAKQADVFAALAQRLVFGGVVMSEDPCAHDSSFQRSTFRHAASEKQEMEFPNN
jgi:predicted lipid-binding transport protein (Tim44 family)